MCIETFHWTGGSALCRDGDLRAGLGTCLLACLDRVVQRGLHEFFNNNNHCKFRTDRRDVKANLRVYDNAPGRKLWRGVLRCIKNANI